MNPLNAFILYTYTTADGETGCRTFLYLDEASATAGGEKFKATKPAEVTSFGYMVLQLEGAPS